MFFSRGELMKFANFTIIFTFYIINTESLILKDILSQAFSVAEKYREFHLFLTGKKKKSCIPSIACRRNHEFHQSVIESNCKFCKLVAKKYRKIRESVIDKIENFFNRS